ncbi:MAG: helix-turn-helix domain-containing protein [Rhodothermales bacterium]|nr:helix-turn-helix domain-containing protein [Rhodothermales bacterium]
MVAVMQNQFAILSTEDLSLLVSKAVEAVLKSQMPRLAERINSPEYFTQEAVCALTGWSRRQLHYRRKKGFIPYCKRGRTVLFRAEQVYAWIEEGYVPAGRSLS